MDRSSTHRRKLVALGTVVWAALMAGGTAPAEDVRDLRAMSPDELWKGSVHDVARGDFAVAAEMMRGIRSHNHLSEQILAWLEEYEAKQAARKELDRADFEKYTGYAQARIEREEYEVALGWMRAALDVAEDRDAFLKTDWVLDCVDRSLAFATTARDEGEWRDAWDIYYELKAIYERNPEYERQLREVSTHLRLDLMFEEDSKWDEYIERVRWEDAREALARINQYYVEPADFKKMTEAGLEQLLLLAESRTARETFPGLADEQDRKDFVSRVQKKLDQARTARSFTVQDCDQYFRRVVRDINRETVRLPEELVVSELMRGALEPLDEFTSIIWPRDSEEFERRTRGDFIGVGIQIVKNAAQEIEVVTPLDDTPAYRAGIQAGDIITAVDGASLEGLSINKVVDVITGPKDTLVTLSARRGDDEIEFPLTRSVVKIVSVKGTQREEDNEEQWNHWLDRENGIGYVRVTNFQRNTVEDVAEVLSAMQAQGLHGLALDLRGNPGGLLDSAWQLSSLFLHRGDDVVSTRGRIKRENQVFPVRRNGMFADVPLVVLVNEGSASASEIVSGAVRDNQRGTVIGARTFGKFSVQNLIPLGYVGAKLKITTAKYYLPNGDSLHRESDSETWGVEPDIPVRLVRWERSNLYKMRREADMLGPQKGGADDDADLVGEAAARHAATANDEEDEDETDDEEEDLTGISRFRTPSGVPLYRLKITELEGPQVPGGETPVEIAVGDKPAEVVATDRRGTPLTIVGAEIKYGELRLTAVDREGNETNIEDLVINGKPARQQTLPVLRQRDENNRPMEDPQLDTALLVLRVSVLGESHPTLADAEPAKEAKSARP